MADFTNEVTADCEVRAVFAIDVLDTTHHLQMEHVSVDETLAYCGFDDQKCAYLREWINKRRRADGKGPLSDDQKVEPATTIREVIGYVC